MKTPTPRTDDARRRLQQMYDAGKLDIAIENTLLDMALFEEELAAVTERLKAAQDGWHDEITKGLSELRRAESIYTQAQERAERAEEQRDRLAAAIRKHKDTLYFTPDFSDEELYEAIQSLNQAAVKGGSDE